MTTPIPDAFAPARLGPIELRNRIIKAATFEGMTANQTVSDRLIKFHRTMARGGVGMTTMAFSAVSTEGAATPNELVVQDDAVPGLRRLVDAAHAEGAAASVQIGHAGAVAGSAGIRGIGPSPLFNRLAMKRQQQATVEDIHRIIGDFRSATKRVREAGFDAVEIHLGHGYLLSEFLSPKLNRRRDEWGGSLENRARFPREVAKVVREAAGDRMAVLAKINMDDGVRGGFGLEECIEVSRMLEADGTIDAIQPTCGSSLQNPMYFFRGDAPIKEMAASMPKAVALGVRVFGRFFLKSYPFEEGYLRKQALQLRAAVGLPIVLLGGINRRESIDQAMAEGFEFVALGRGLLRNPELINEMARGTADDSLCIHCNKCMATIYSGTHCVLVDEELRA